MPFLKVRILVMLVVSAAVAVILGACGSNAFPTPTPTAPGASSPSASATPALTGLAAEGQQLFTEYTCTTCHSVTGHKIVGPPLNGVYESKVTLSNGKTVVADANYLKLSILEPDAQIVNGYPSGVMSSQVGQFQSQIAQGNHLDALLAYIESLK